MALRAREDTRVSWRAGSAAFRVWGVGFDYLLGCAHHCFGFRSVPFACRSFSLNNYKTPM